MDPGFAVGVGVLWVLFSLFRRKGRQRDRKEGSSGPRPQRGRPVPLPPSSGSDPTQREGVRLQDILRELGKTLDEAARQRQGQSAGGRSPTAKRVEAGRPLEQAAEVRSLEEEVRRPERAEVDSDDEAEAIVARRIAAAEANARPLGAADHLAFDARIRQEPADATATQGYTMRQMRDAVVWREILGPPVSLRDPADS